MSYLLDIFNKRQPAPQQERIAPSFDTVVNMGEPLPFGRPMTMPSGGPNTGSPMPPPGLAAMFPGGATPPPMGAGPSWASMTGNMSGGGMGGGMPAFNLPPNFSVSGPQQMPNSGMGGGMWSAVDRMPANPSMGGGMWSGPAPMAPGMGGVSQMPAFQPPQPMPFNNRPMPQFGAPNFSMQNGTIGAPQPSPMNGMMKGMFGVR